MESKQALNNHRKGYEQLGLMNYCKQDHCSSESVRFPLVMDECTPFVRKCGSHRGWLFQIMVVPARERPFLASNWPLLGSSSHPINWLSLEAKEHSRSFWNVMDSVGKGTMTRRESSGEEEVMDPLYNGLICHAQCWFSHPDFATKIVSWAVVRLRLWHSWSQVLSVLYLACTLSSLRHVSSVKLSQALHSGESC